MLSVFPDWNQQCPFLLAPLPLRYSRVSHCQSHCEEAQFGSRFILLMIYHPDSCLSSLWYVLTRLECVIPGGFTREMSLVCQRMAWLPSAWQSNWEGASLWICVNVRVYKNRMLWKFSVTAAGQTTHLTVTGIFDAHFYKTLVGAVDSSLSAIDLAVFWLCSITAPTWLYNLRFWDSKLTKNAVLKILSHYQ